jgi:GH35 family endo-1,4-beta-xylanase
MAKAANPNPQYYYADYGIESMVGRTKNKSEAVYNFVTSWADANNSCGISGVAMKVHLSTNATDEEIDGIKSNIERYQKHMLFVHMTEVEVTCELQEQDGVTMCKDKLDEAKQAAIYQKLLTICLNA